MTALRRAALARLPLTVEEVESLYKLNMFSRDFTVAKVRQLCESHERLRAELDGSAVVIADLERENAELRRWLDEADY